MKTGRTLLLLACPLVGWAQLELVPRETAQCVFGGGARRIEVVFYNGTGALIEADLATRVFQASSATAAPWGEARGWKKLSVLGGQTVLESVRLELPRVRAGCRFLVQWIAATNRLLGTTEVMAYPEDLLHELAVLAGEKPLGVFDPKDELKPLLGRAGVPWADLDRSGREGFEGKLALLGPFAGAGQAPARFSDFLQNLAKRGAAVVWVKASTERAAEPETSDWLIRCGEGAVVVAAARSLAHLADSPRAQLNLVRLARLAVKGQPLALSDSTE